MFVTIWSFSPRRDLNVGISFAIRYFFVHENTLRDSPGRGREN